jgi:hypothetical protein
MLTFCSEIKQISQENENMKKSHGQDIQALLGLFSSSLLD